MNQLRATWIAKDIVFLKGKSRQKMIIRDGGTTNAPPGIPMSMSPEYPLDGGEHLSNWLFSWNIFSILHRCCWRGGSCYGQQVLESGTYPQLFAELFSPVSLENHFRRGRSDGHHHRLSLLLDHLHLRDGHLPLRVLRLLLERETGGGGGGGEEFSQRGGRSLIARIREVNRMSRMRIKFKVGRINSSWYGLVFCHDPLNKSRPRKLFLLSFENLFKKYISYTLPLADPAV